MMVLLVKGDVGIFLQNGGKERTGNCVFCGNGGRQRRRGDALRCFSLQVREKYDILKENTETRDTI